MGGRHHPLSYEQVVTALKKLGFHKRDHDGTSHEQWVPVDDNAPFRKVTVDKPKQPYGQDLIKWMAAQAGVTKKRFYELATSR